MRHLLLLLSFVSLFLSSCGISCGTSSQRPRSRLRERQYPIATHRTSHISGVDSIFLAEQGRFSWKEYGHEYKIDLSHVTLRYTRPRPTVLSGSETLSYEQGKWADLMNQRLGSVGVRMDRLILSVPGHLVVFRGFESLSRQRHIDCLIGPMSMKGDEPYRWVAYSKPDYFYTENMAVRELYEMPQDGYILIVDHFRDRNADGDLTIAYILQDIRQLSPKDEKKYQFFGHIDHYDLFRSRGITYQYINRTLSPITLSLFPSTQYRLFEPRSESELIPRTFFLD